ncbi:hypothetical protein M569_08950 [Genlisea aurea]|uniref:Uncharacterized protein n=1 Tax=Genlisea aurea TaxID=192259 RepID=S8E0K8_9LAMI|nr:hypothetical protein M569_08950 [Genlisea aurea]
MQMILGVLRRLEIEYSLLVWNIFSNVDDIDKVHKVLHMISSDELRNTFQANLWFVADMFELNLRKGSGSRDYGRSFNLSVAWLLKCGLACCL